MNRLNIAYDQGYHGYKVHVPYKLLQIPRSICGCPQGGTRQSFTWLLLFIANNDNDQKHLSNNRRIFV